MLKLFADNLLPVFLIAGAGYLLAWRTRMDARPIARIAFAILAPALVFDAIVESGVSGTAFLRMVGYGATVLLGLGALTALIGRTLRWSRQLTTGAVLVVMLPNAGNYGLSVNLFAFGQPGLTQATLFFVTSSLITFTAGVFVASMGRAPWTRALTGLVRVPAVWALALALAMRGTGTSLPFPLQRAVSQLAAACVPVFILILGMQLHAGRLRGPRGPLVTATTLRMLGGAGAGLLVAPLFGLQGTAHQAAVLQASMPSAVITTILAGQYDLEPDFITQVVLVTTLLSPLTITPLLALLGA